MMKYGSYPLMKLLPLLAVSALAVMAGCSDDTTKPPSEFSPPSNLRYVNGDGQVNLTWDGSSDEARNDFGGYHVYRGTASLANATIKELDDARITTTPLQAGVRSRLDTNATNGVKYYYSVRAVLDNGDLSTPTNEIDTAARPGGNIITTLGEFADPNRPSGMDLSEGTAYSLVIDNLTHVDFFLGTTDDGNASGFPLSLKSPSLVGGPNAAQWATREATFKLLDGPDVATTSASGFANVITLGATPDEIRDKVIAVKLPVDENGEIHFGKIEILDTEGAAGQRVIEFIWAFQMVPNYIRF